MVYYFFQGNRIWPQIVKDGGMFFDFVNFIVGWGWQEDLFLGKILDSTLNLWCKSFLESSRHLQGKMPLFLISGTLKILFGIWGLEEVFLIESLLAGCSS